MTYDSVIVNDVINDITPYIRNDMEEIIRIFDVNIMERIDKCDNCILKSRCGAVNVVYTINIGILYRIYCKYYALKSHSPLNLVYFSSNKNGSTEDFGKAMMDILSKYDEEAMTRYQAYVAIAKVHA